MYILAKNLNGFSYLTSFSRPFRIVACHYQPASRCHPERREGSAGRVRDAAGRQRSFAALRMTGERVFVMACDAAGRRRSFAALRMTGERVFVMTWRAGLCHGMP